MESSVSSQNIVFIIGAFRSGTTAMTMILDTASNAKFYVEQSPKLCVDTRSHYEGILTRPSEFIFKSKNPSIKNTLASGKHWGDKNHNYLFFLDELMGNWDCKFLFLFRDGREVVRSCMNFHRGRKGYYVRYEDDPNSDLTQAEDYLWDYGRPRPRKDSELYDRWQSIPRFEKLSWYWTKYNEILLEKLENLEPEIYETVNMNTVNPDKVQYLFEFFDLKSFSKKKTSSMLSQKINTTNVDEDKSFPHWKNWTEDQRQIFMSYARPVMNDLGYVS